MTITASLTKPAMTTGWYVLKSKPRQELRARQELENQRFEVFLPQITVEKIRNGKPVPVAEPLFPGYLFVELDTVDSNWRALRSTRGVSHVLSFGDTLPVVPREIITFLRQRTDPAAVRVRRYLQPNAQVRIIDGPFRNLEAVFVEYDGERRALLLLELLGKLQTLSFPLDQLRVTDTSA